ncbi:transcription elongation factor GreAB [Marinomonas fungiae]|uniref:transcription elongation factor GreAB n=1 Tax=Marinomonas fungiae TaxID=1137284 RepID=UPI003A8F525E
MFLEQLQLSLIEYAETRVKVAKEAADQAHQAATSTESVAETKWDTFGLENSYLAHGQSVRVAECEADLAYFRKMAFADSDEIAVGSVFEVERRDGWNRVIILSQCCGGGEFENQDKSILLVTPQTPLGKSLLGKEEGDEVIMKSRGVELVAEIVRIFL